MSYFLMGPTNTPTVASAFAPESVPTAYELLQQVSNLSEMPFEFSLVKLTTEQSGLVKSSDLSGLESLWIDYLPNSLAWPLFSQRLMTVVSNALSGEEGISWLRAKVNHNKEQYSYFIPVFLRLLDVLDVQKTMFVKGTDHIIRPCFSKEKVQRYEIFHLPASNNLWKITPSLYVSEKLKKAVQKDKLTGITFDKANVG